MAARGGGCGFGAQSARGATISTARHLRAPPIAQIILGIGGDDSSSAEGVFFEGVMTQGYSSDAIDDLVQADIVAAKYGQ